MIRRTVNSMSRRWEHVSLAVQHEHRCKGCKSAKEVNDGKPVDNGICVCGKVTTAILKAVDEVPDG